MRRLPTAALCLSAALFLSGCSVNARSYRELEQIRLIQTMGLDLRADRTELSLSSGLGLHDEPPLIICRDGDGLEDALASAQDYSPENELFFAHVNYLLLGEDTARQGIERWLEWFERIPNMRMGTSFYIVREGTARDLVCGSSGDTTDVTERMTSLEKALEDRGLGDPSTVLDVDSALAERDAAVCLAVCLAEGEDSVPVSGGDSDTVLPAGLAIFRGGRLVDFAEQDEALAAAILQGRGPGAQLVLSDATVELTNVRAAVEPVFDGGAVTGVLVRLTAEAGLQEALAPGVCAQNTGAELSGELVRRMETLLAREKTLRCDFLGIWNLLERAAPEKTPAYSPEALERVVFTVTADARVTRNYDLQQSRQDREQGS